MECQQRLTGSDESRPDFEVHRVGADGLDLQLGGFADLQNACVDPDKGLVVGEQPAHAPAELVDISHGLGDLDVTSIVEILDT